MVTKIKLYILKKKIIFFFYLSTHNLNGTQQKKVNQHKHIEKSDDKTLVSSHKIINKRSSKPDP